MKFKHYLESITGIGIFPLISLTIFFVFFVAVTYWVIRADKKYITTLKKLPFENDNGESGYAEGHPEGTITPKQ
jgi:cytochrome c oxidase cbb3-type subunit 4